MENQISNLLSTSKYMIVDRIKKRIISIDNVYSKIATGYTPSTGDVVINLDRLRIGLIEKRYRLKYLGGF